MGNMFSGQKEVAFKKRRVQHEVDVVNKIIIFQYMNTETKLQCGQLCLNVARLQA
jgi:hypothetical protein